MASSVNGQASRPSQSPRVRIVVSPLAEVDDIEAFRALLGGVPGVRIADLEEYDFPTATYTVDTEDPARLSRALVESRDPLVERLTRTGGTIRLELPPSPQEQPVLVVPDALPPARPRTRRLPRRSPWLLADLAALALVVAVAVIALVIHAQSSAPGSNHTATPAAARLGAPVTASVSVAASATTTAAPRVIVATPLPTSTPAPRSPTTAPTAAPRVSATPAATAAPTATLAPTSSPTPRATPTPPPPAAVGVVDAMREQGLPIGAEQAESPAAGAAVPFLSAESFQDNRLPISGDPFNVINGGAVEVYPSAQDAAQRLQELTLIARAVPDAAEYDFQRGAIVLRLSRRLAQADVQAYENALAVATPAS